MAWFGDGLSSLSNLKGQISNFTKEVLSEGIVDEIDERSIELKEANEKCVQLQDLLNSRDAEISLLRRQNYELQKTVVELNAKPQQTNDGSQDDEGGGFFWDPPSIKNRESKGQNQARALQDQLAQATLRIRELEAELKKAQKASTTAGLMEEFTESHQKTELLRAKQDMMNRIIQMGEKSREAERNVRRLQSDEASLIDDFRTIIGELRSPERLELIRGALRALESENQKYSMTAKEVKSDAEEKDKSQRGPGFESVSLMSNGGENSNLFKTGTSSNREAELRGKIAELEEENKRLTVGMEELDQQHGESIEQVLAIKEELLKKHQTLQKAYEQLYVDYNGVQGKLEVVETKLAAAEANNVVVERSEKSEPQRADSRDKDVQTEVLEGQANSEETNNEIEELERKVRDILKTSPLEINENQSICEAVARQYVETKWKKDVLERKVNEVSRELKYTADRRDALQEEVDDMQTNIESLLLQIQHLKSSLPSIPESSEERVATLETEIESLHEETKRLRAENRAARQKNSELAAAVSSAEASSKQRENLEAELRNAKQQLDIARQRLSGISKNVEDKEGVMEDAGRKLHVSLEENNELRKEIDRLESSERQAREQLRMSLEKCKGLDENNELIEELKLDLENARRELKGSLARGKQLECELVALRDGKNEIEADIEVIAREKERLEAELLMLRETGTKDEGSELLNNLREQLDAANRDKDDLEYDILNMRKELDQALGQVDLNESQLIKLNQDNERLVRENTSLLDQLTVVQDESLDKVELLSMEKLLLEQECATLKQANLTTKSENSEILKNLNAADARRTEVESELAALKLHAAKLQSENDDLRTKEEQCAILEEKLKSTEEKLREAEDNFERAENNLANLRSKETELSQTQKRCKELEEQIEAARDIEERLRSSEERCRGLESELESLRLDTEKANVSQEQAMDTEKRQILQILDEKARENATLKTDNNRLMTAIADEQRKHESLLESSQEAAEMARETIESLSQLIKEKDSEIQSIKDNTSDPVHSATEIELSSIKNERDELVKLVQLKHNESLQYHAEIQRLTQLLNEQAGSIQKLAAERDTNATVVKEKEAQILWAENELQVVRQRLKNFEESNNYGETCGIVEHSVQIAQAATLAEKSKALEAALIQEQSNNRMLQNQLTESQNKGANAAKELERLRTHLVEMEASYTEEALLAEQSRKELEAKLVQAEEKVKNSSTVYTSASIRANQQVETLQQQMALIVQQRDDIQNKLSAAEDKVLSHSASLMNLQIVLEQFQRDKEKDIQVATEKIRQQLEQSLRKEDEWSNEVSHLKDQLSEAKECLKAASRLSDELERKTERIEQLTQEVARLTELVNTADQRIQEVSKSGEGKVDKTLVKNLLLGYLSSPTMDKSSVLRVFATILDFDDSEKDKAGLTNSSTHGGWFSGLLHSGSAPPTKDQEASLSAAFVRFLESESKPKAQLPPLPLSTTPPSRPGHSRQHSSSSTQSTLLLSNISLPTFPDFVPARNTGSILKEVLKDS